MQATDRIRERAEAAMQALRARHIPPTPRNFELWYAFRGDEHPALTKRIDELSGQRDALTPGMLDALHAEFLGDTLDFGAMNDNSHELGLIAASLVDRIDAGSGAIEGLNGALRAWSPVLSGQPEAGPIGEAIGVLRTATTETSERLRALEQLFAASVSRIGELQEALAHAETAATRDALTGLANRRMFDRAMSQAAADGLRDGTDVALLLLDIDHFKTFNDTYGHPVGDNVLRLLARVLTDHIKGRDTAARYGGEEFAIILVGASLKAAITVGDQIREILERRPLVNRATGQKLGVVTCSVGAAVLRRAERLGDLIARTDEALYTAKRTGRNRVCAETMAVA